MGKFDGVLLVSDICDTLVDTSSGAFLKDENGEEGDPVPVLERDRRALEYFTAEGGRFTIATGRALKYVQFYADSVPINVPGVLGDGSAICDVRSGEYLETAVLGEEVRELGQAVADRFPTTTLTVRHLDGEYRTVRPDAMARFVDVLEVSSLLEVPLPIQRLWVRVRHSTLVDDYRILKEDRGTLRQVRDFLRAQGADSAYELTFTSENENQLQMAARGSAKGDMVRRLARRLGISMEHVYCVGNGDDDVSMLAAAKQGFAPANCDQAAKDCGATLVCCAGRGVLADVVGILDKKY